MQQTFSPRRLFTNDGVVEFPCRARVGDRRFIGRIRLVHDNDGDTPLRMACMTFQETGPRRDVALVRLLLARGATVNVANVRDETPLHAAATGLATEIVEVLLAADADIHARDARGDTPLDLAVWYRRREVGDLLMRHEQGQA